MSASWEQRGESRMTDEQRGLLNAAAGDLAKQVSWHGRSLSKDDWRHMLAGTILKWRFVPGIDVGEGPPGLIALGGSSLSLSKSQATEAITMAFHIGDHPDEQGLKCKPVTWCDVVYLARRIPVDER